MTPKACIIIPTYNEAENLARLVPLIFAEASKIPSHELHILVVDDNSPDRTRQVAEALAKTYPTLHVITGEKKGLGDAYQRGIAHALDTLDPDLIFEMDADLQHSPAMLPIFVSLANHGFSLVIGSRFAPGGSTPDFSLYRTLLSRVGNLLIRYLGGIPRIHDCTSGYRCIKTEILRKCDLSQLATRGYSFQSSLLCELLHNHARVIEVPITFPDRVHGNSKLSLRDQLEFLGNLFRIRFRQSREFIQFCIVGGSGVVVNMGLYLLLTRGYGMALEIASPLAIECSILSNFTLNNLWTFRRRATTRSLARRLFLFHGIALLAGSANYLLFLAMVHTFHLWDIPAYLLGIACGTMINYVLNSWITWKRVKTILDPD